MNIYFLILCTLLLLFLSGNAFYVTFKKFEDEGDYSGGTATGEFCELVFGILEFISKKIFPERYHIIIFKIFSFAFGLFMLGLAILLWIL
ncbi:hypothetical protein CN692_21770 [Bacillus sp. AFS002410]|uniref:hypothetical protein n=1 Tax=Bacillus sp. AFS002410 TaxID=2033481 RepID=UPI000BF13D8F|nr:hypothetical protein [Bacillus sp. AFS002410]PEJ52344.1 hypothetical protein CN692_21770 [Bacillus sp. AFS002410]